MTDIELKLAHEFLLREYDNATKVTFHADEFRDKLSTFFLAFAGAAVTAVGFLVQDNFKVQLFGDKRLTAGLLLIGVSMIGVLILIIHARLRKVQLEHFELVNRIRVYCFQRNLSLWNTIRLSKRTLPKIELRRWSGSEAWALTIVLPTATLFATGADLLFRWREFRGLSHAVSAGLACVALFGLWHLYSRMATAPARDELITEQEAGAWFAACSPSVQNESAAADPSRSAPQPV